jgi:trimeric autotransporter adhesin
MTKPLHAPNTYRKQIHAQLRTAIEGFFMRIYNTVMTRPVKTVPVLLAISFLLCANKTHAQVLVETFEEPVWSTNLHTPTGTQTVTTNGAATSTYASFNPITVTMAATSTSTNQTITTQSTNVSTCTKTVTTNVGTLASNWVWYLWGGGGTWNQVTTATNWNAGGGVAQQHSVGTLVHLQNGYIATPVISEGIAQVTFWGYANSSFSVGVKTIFTGTYVTGTSSFPNSAMPTTTANNTTQIGNVQQMFAANSSTYPAQAATNAANGNLSQFTYTVPATLASTPLQLAIWGGGNGVSIDDIVITSPLLVTATTGTATSISTTGATINGIDNAGGVAGVTSTFDYGTTTGYGTNVAGSPSSITGSSPTAISYSIIGLTPNTVYHFRANAVNGSPVNGADANFTTISLAPTVGSPGSIVIGGFTANWTAPASEGAAAYTYTIQYSTDNTFGSGVTTVTGISSGATSYAISGIGTTGTYYYEVEVVNAGGASAWSSVSTGAAVTGSPNQYSAVTINTSASAGGIWASSGSGASLVYTFTPNSSTSNINATDIVDILTGTAVSLTSGTATVTAGIPGSVVITSTCSSGGGPTPSITVATAITAANTSTSTAYTLTLTSTGNITVNSSSAINLTGANGSGSDPAPGILGDNIVFTAGSGSTVSISSSITTSGGNGQASSTGATASGAGGAAGTITVTGPGGIAISGTGTTLTSSGGAGAAGKSGDGSSASGAGGAGGAIALNASSGTINITGTVSVLVSSGGNGGGNSNGFGGAGGTAGAINVSSSGNISIGSSTGITANGGSGGSATQTATAGVGGTGGSITVSSSGGTVTINSTSPVNSLGGAGAQANNGNPGSNGGSGSNISISGVNGITVSSAISTTGGNGGGPNGQPTTEGNGGAAGYISLYSSSGAVSITAALTATGGTGANTGGGGVSNTGGAGGNGGAISITGTSGIADNTAISSAGGAGGNSSGQTNGNGGNAGTITLTGAGGMTISSSVSAAGGAVGTGGTGGSAGTSAGITVTDGNGTVTSGGVNDGISGVLSGLNFSSTGTGILKVSATNNYTGTTTISNGTLQTAAASGIPSTSNVILNGGTLSGNGSFTDQMGTLTLSANSTINYASGSTLLKFTASNAASWGGNTLSVTGWTGTTGVSGGGAAGKLFFGTTSSGLTAAQLSNISFSTFAPGAVYITSPSVTGEVVPPAGSITTGTISGSPFCNGASVSVPFTYSGAVFSSSTVYTAELSDASGSFASPTNIGTVTGITSGSGTINATIPINVTNGTGYLIKVVSTSPSITGTNNGTNLTVSGQSITLSSGSATQNVCPGNAVTSIVYTLSGAATGTSISWSPSTPAGISYNSGTYTISGTPTIAGSYSYTITTSGSSCTAATATGTITVGQTAILTSGTGTDNQNVCVNNSIVNITYNVGAATGVTVSGGSFPSGVSGNLSGGVYTISGTPTVAGTYNYTITTSGACGSAANANGKIVVSGLPAIASSNPGSPSLLYSFTSGSSAVNSGADNWGNASDSGSYLSQGADRFGISNNAYAFTGVKGYISNTTSNAPTYNPYSEGIWFKTSVAGGVLMGLSNTNSSGVGGTSYDHTLYMDNSGNVYFGVFTGGASHPVASSSGYNYADGKWHLAVGTISSGNGETLYIDGALAGSNSSANNPSSGGEDFVIIGANNLGSWEHNPPSDNYFSGGLDEAIIYNNTELTAAQAASIYDIGYASVSAVSSCGVATISVQAFGLATGTYTVSYNVSGTNTVSTTTATMSYASGTPGSGTFTTADLPTSGSSNVVNITGIANSNGCTTNVSMSTPAFSTTGGAITYTWTGAVDSNWAVPANWSCAALPLSTSDVTIPYVGPTYKEPVLSADVTVHSVNLSNGSSTLNINGHTFTINGTASGTGTYSGSSTSSMAFGGSSTGTVYFTGGANTLQNISLTDGANITIGNALNIASSGIVTVGSVSGATLASGGNITLVSDNNGSARVAAVPVSSGTSLSTISGIVNVQCYIHSSLNAQGITGPLRAWRLLTAPVSNVGLGTPTSIYNSWQDSGISYTLKPGVGTRITELPSLATGGSGNGMDPGINGNYSDYVWSGTALSPVTNTITNDISGTGAAPANIGYFIFVRGDRDPTTVNYPTVATQNNTTLSAAGVLQLGDQTFTSTLTASTGLMLVGNPYASPVNMKFITGDSTGYTSTLVNLSKRFYVWNANLAGSQNVGGYQCIDNASGTYTINLNGATVGASTPAYNNLQIQSGEAVFMQANSTGGACSVTFKESQKSAGLNFVYRPEEDAQQENVSTQPAATVTGVLSLLNSDGTTSLTDGIVAQFNNGYSDNVDDTDAPKFSNFDEMFSLERSGKLLCIERRADLNAAIGDTLFLDLKQTEQRDYQFKFFSTVPNHPGLGGHLEDAYTGIHTPLNLVGSNTVNFTIDGNAPSQAENRFMIVFGGVNITPVYTDIKATRQGNTVLVQWSLSNDQSMTGYVLQRSTDGGATYTTVYTTTANHTTGIYSWIDDNPVVGRDYYRVISTDVLNEESYSNIVSVTIAALYPSGIIVYPDPVHTPQIGVAFNNMPSGVYQYTIFDALGQKIQTGSITHGGGNATHIIVLTGAVTKGAYPLQVLSPDNTRTVINVIYQ